MIERPNTPEEDDDEIVDLDSLFEEVVLSDGDSEREFLKTQWIERVLNQLVSLRVTNNVTQRELGERIGKPQSSIARIEAASDMKLSVLWDYLSAIGLSPATPLQTNTWRENLTHSRRTMESQTNGHQEQGLPMHSYKRVVVKMSGGAFSGPKDWGFDQSAIDGLAKELISLSEASIQVAVMVGGGNIFRGRIADQWGIERVEADHIGMTATVLNALMLRAALKAQKQDLEVRVMSAVPMAAFAEPFIRLRAIKHLEKGYVVLFAAGTGQPLVTTDYPAVQRAIEIDADALLAAKQGIEGVYTADPNMSSEARLYETISYNDVLTKQLMFMDQSAILLARDHDIPVHVFDSARKRAMLDICQGRFIGSFIGPDAVTTVKDTVPSAD